MNRAYLRSLVVSVMLVTLPAAVAAEARDQFDNSHGLEGPREGYTVVDFAAAWCEPCYEVLPRLQGLAREHPGVRFLVVSVDDEIAGRDRLVETLDLELPVLWDEGHVLIERFAPRAFPATYVLDPEGRVVHHHTGDSRKAWGELVELLDRIDS